MNRLFILIVLNFTYVYSGGHLNNYDGRFETKNILLDTVEVSLSSELSEISSAYPARSLIRSLIFPGWGQIYNKSPWWKPVLFAGIEISALAGWWQWRQKADDLRLKYETYADTHWDIYDWVTQTYQLQETLFDTLIDMGYNWDPDVEIIGTHHLDIVYNNQIYSSDCLYDIHWSEESSQTDCLLPGTPEGMDEDLYNSEYIPALIESGSISVIKDRDYYENIGKYDQFAGGWNGISGDYIIQFKDVGDTTEIIITSPIKDDYLSQRKNSNDYLNMATYAVSAVMFNHVISAFEAVWTSTRQTGKKEEVKTSVNLIYDKHARYGLGGISFSVRL